MSNDDIITEDQCDNCGQTVYRSEAWGNVDADDEHGSTEHECRSDYFQEVEY